VLIFPWKLIADPSGYIFTWLVGYSGLLGPIGGIMITDYYLIRREHLAVDELYRYDGRYGYRNGVNSAAIVALVLGVLPNIPGFLVAIGVLAKTSVWPWLTALYSYAWFVGFLVSGVVYLLLMRRNGNSE
jgi:NCS1 family nucleobase:cation symporter-1